MHILNHDVAHEKPPQTHKVFVYGTLKRGYHNFEGYLAKEKLLGEAQVEGILLHCGGFPALSLADKFTWIKGEVYEVSDQALDNMDRLEGHPDWYNRIQLLIGQFGLCWVYTFPQVFSSKESQVIQGGEWRGTHTPSVHWLGVHKGVTVGNFSALPALDTIRVGSGDRFVLRRNLVKQTYDLVTKDTGEFVGSYKHLGDMEGRDGKIKPILRLPPVSHVVKEHMAADGKVTVENRAVVPYNPPSARSPITYFDPSEHEKRQAKKLEERIEAMGLKVRMA